jgi:hypothetical protein
MRIRDLSLPRLILLHLSLFIIPIAAWTQTPSPQSRIVDRVNESALVTLRGNTHPLAQPQFDQGAAPPDLPMARMLLVLKRSDAQEVALQKLLDDQQDQNSPMYRQWLTPDQFGLQFGPTDQDVQEIVAWLRSHGFQIGAIGRGRSVIEFSGTATQVRQAFHTEIRKYTVNGENHWANADDPQIPAALAPVVAGVNSLHNFPKKPMYRLVGKVSRPVGGAASLDLGSEFTIPSSQCSISGNCYFVGPYDFATIYNVLPLWNATTPIDGTGQSIAILGESNINIQDVRDFRNIFGLPANDPQIILNGPDPGLVPGLETEADLDVEWSGAVAKAATIKLVVTAPTNSTDGVDLSAVYAVENSVGPIISESFGECELFLGTAGNSFQNGIRQQAAAQGITFINSSGDEGSARCDPSVNNPPDPATHGLAVSGLASSPNGVAVGGTDFQNFGANFNFGVASPYWNLTNNGNQASAISYIPETTWNENCTNNVFVILKAGTSPEASCNNPQLANAVETEGGGGGKSTCITSDGANPSSCSGGYTKPGWQSAPGVPADSARDIPDVSLFASAGFMDSAYILCESDLSSFTQPCSLNGPFNTFWGIGGTSTSAPAFAGIMALVNQFTGSAGQGNANYVLYKMASSSAQTSNACGATSNPSAGCVFYDVTSGTIAVPCAKGSPDCTVSNGSDLYGVLSGYSAGAGYDLATGLGSVNAFNLVHNWIQPTTSSTTTLSLNGGKTVSITHGQSIPFDIAVTPSAATGLVSLEGTPTGNASVSMSSFALQNGVASGTTTSLAGGTSYAVKAHYSGNGTYRPSDSAPVTVTVAPEPSKTLISIPVFDPKTGLETGNTPTSVVYGTPVALRVDVGNSQAAATFPSQLVCAPLACATGTVTLTDTLTGTLTTLSPAGGYPLNNGGYVEDDSVPLLSGGTHQFAATYPGDNSYQNSAGNYSLAVTPAPVQLGAPYPAYSPFTFIVGTPGPPIIVEVTTSLYSGAEPTGAISFYDGSTQLQSTVSYFGGKGFPGIYASLQGTITTTFSTSGTHQITAKYSGDANYGAGTSAATSITALYATNAAETANPTTINLGQSITFGATVTGASKTPPMTGTIQFQVGSSFISPATVTQGTDSSGNQTLTATVSAEPQFGQDVQVNYSGDANYASSSAFVSIQVNVPDFKLNLATPGVNINAGQSGSAVLTLTPQTNVSSAVSLACDVSQIVGASCAFSPASPISLLNGAAATTTLSISTLPPSSSTAQSAPRQLTLPKWVLPTPWLTASFVNGLAVLFLCIWPIREHRRLMASLGMLSMLCIAVGCGAGSGYGGGGGGGGGQVATSLTISTSSNKTQAGSPVTLTAVIHSTRSVTGLVDFSDGGVNTLGSIGIVNGTATATYTSHVVGTHMITAVYYGDTYNLPSRTSGPVNQVFTGTATVGVSGTTSTISHSASINVTIQ